MSLLSFLTEPLHYEYMLKAILVSSVIGGICAVLSSFLVLKGWSLLGDALSHSVVPGVVIAYAIGVPFAIGAFFTGLLSVLGIGFVKTRTRIREDAVIGVVFTAFFAAGLLLLSKIQSQISLKSIMFGNLLGISNFDTIQCLVIGGISFVLVLLFWKDLMLFCFDANHARSLGLRTNLLYFLLLSLLSLTTVAALQAVGACLVVAMLITPGATAYLMTDRFGKMMVIAGMMGTLCCAAGAYLSYFLNGSTGGCIVTLQTLLFVLAFCFSPKHGLFRRRFGMIRKNTDG
ncbi:MAG: metal ABC transporter permease [Spirochaetia bacterium]|nr:metal ABC transporter permease [Spirochaetia bacterium]